MYGMADNGAGLSGRPTTNGPEGGSCQLLRAASSPPRIATEGIVLISSERALAGSHCDRSGQLRVREITPWFRD